MTTPLQFIVIPSKTVCTLGVLFAVFGFCLSGCGSSDTAVVSPPAPQTADPSSSEPRSTDPPGGMEMPADLVLETSETAKPKGGGLEMPENVEVRKPDITIDEHEIDEPETAKILFASWDEIQATLKGSGKITIIDLWSLSCEPCLKEFPELVLLHQQFADQETIQCVAVNLDFDGRKSRPPQHYKDRVEKFLTVTRATKFPTYLCTTPSDDVFAAADIISIPSVLIYSADGTLEQKFVDAGDTIGFTYKRDVLPWIEKRIANR